MKKRLGIPIKDYESADDIKNTYFKFANIPFYNISDFDFSKPKYKVIIENGLYTLSLKRTLIILFYELVNKINLNTEYKIYYH